MTFYSLIQQALTRSKLTTETIEQSVKYVLYCQFEHILQLVLVFLLLSLNM